MSNFNPGRLFVSYANGVTATGPIFPRCYTHSDVTGELFLQLDFIMHGEISILIEMKY